MDTLLNNNRHLQFEIKPIIGARYKHLTVPEIKWVCNRNNSVFERRLKELEVVWEKYSSLEKLESEIPQIIGKGNFWGGIPKWYITQLVILGRISVDLSHIYELVTPDKEIFYPGCPIFDYTFINDFFINAEMMGYTTGLSACSVRSHLLCMFIYYRCNTEQIYEKLDDYLNIIAEFKSSANYGISIIKNVLINMGYGIGECTHGISSRVYKNGLDNKYKIEFKYTNSEQYLEAFNDYMAYLEKTSPHKTRRTNISHIVCFYNFIGEKYPYVDKLCEISNSHIVNFREYQLNRINCFGRKNTVETVNHSIQAVNKMWKFLKLQNLYEVSEEIVTVYDNIKESRVYSPKILHKEVIDVINCIRKYENPDKIQEKAALMILILTGRRIHEVLSLKYNCFSWINDKPFIHFHKTKNNNSINEYISDECVRVVVQAKEFADKFNYNIYSSYDNLICRRLFPSYKKRGRSIIGISVVSNLFKKIQIENGIVDEGGFPKYTLHDNKKNFVSLMLATGITPIEISNFLGQQVDSLLPYEINNMYALETLKRVEGKGLLTGSAFEQKWDIGYDSTKDVVDLFFSDFDVISRHKENLIYSIRNPSGTMPLVFGVCTDKYNMGLCGDLLCLACEEFKVSNLEEIDELLRKIYKHLYTYGKNKEFRNTDKKISNTFIKIYTNFDKSIDTQLALRRIKDIKRNVGKEYEQ